MAKKKQQDMSEFAADAEKAEEVKMPTGRALKHITKLANEALELEREIDKADTLAGKKKEELNKILDEKLPSALKDYGISSFKLADGTSIDVKDVVEVSLPKKNRAEGLSWLRKNKLGDLIKTGLTMSFGRGEGKIAHAVEKSLRKEGVDYEKAETVHPQTLKAWGRERLQAGKDIPKGIFTIYEGQRAKIKTPKKKG